MEGHVEANVMSQLYKGPALTEHCAPLTAWSPCDTEWQHCVTGWCQVPLLWTPCTHHTSVQRCHKYMLTQTHSLFNLESPVQTDYSQAHCLLQCQTWQWTGGLWPGWDQTRCQDTLGPGPSGYHIRYHIRYHMVT